MSPSPTPGQALKESRLPLPLLRRGKVREVYEVDAGHVLLVASDRVSAFDIVMREPIPRKGAVLTQISAFWFDNGTGGRQFGIGIGSLVLTANVVLLASYTLGCHSLRHIAGGGRDDFRIRRRGRAGILLRKERLERGEDHRRLLQRERD